MNKLIKELLDNNDPYYIHKKFEKINYKFAYNLMDSIGEENYDTLMFIILRMVKEFNEKK